MVFCLATSNVSRSTTISADKPLSFQRGSRVRDARENICARRVVTRPCAFSCSTVSASSKACECKVWHCCRKSGWFSLACVR